MGRGFVGGWHVGIGVLLGMWRTHQVQVMERWGRRRESRWMVARMLIHGDSGENTEKT